MRRISFPGRNAGLFCGIREAAGLFVFKRQVPEVMTGTCRYINQERFKIEYSFSDSDLLSLFIDFFCNAS